MKYVSIKNVQKYEWYVFDTEHSTELIQTRTEPLRNKLVFTEQLIPIGAIFILIYLSI